MSRDAPIDGDQIVIGRPPDGQVSTFDDDLPDSPVRVRDAQERPRGLRTRDRIDPRFGRIRFARGCVARGLIGRRDRRVSGAPDHRLGEPRVDADIGPQDGRIGEEIDPRPVDDGIPVRASE
jgi:hypothetical protein